MADIKKVKTRKIKNVSIDELDSRKDVKRKKSTDEYFGDRVEKVKGRKIKKDVKAKEGEKVSQKTANRKVDSEKREKKSPVQTKKVKPRKIRMTYTAKEEQALDKAFENEDNFSIGILVVVLLFCFVVGIVSGYILYRIAINCSNAMMLVRYLWK